MSKKEIYDGEISVEGLRNFFQEKNDFTNMPTWDVHDLMIEQGSFRGTATQLSELLRNRFGKEYAPSWLTRNLIQRTDELLSYGVSFRLVRVHGYREIELKYDRQGDSKDGALLLVEIVDDAVTQNPENLSTEPIALGDSIFRGDSNPLAG